MTHTSGVIQLYDLGSRLKRFDRLMGLDLGDKTIGLSLSDVERRLASPLDTIRRKKFSVDVAQLLERAREFSIAGFVLGLPLNMSGDEGPRAQATRAFARNLITKTDVPIIFWDERLSTAAVERELISLDVSRNKRAEIIDQMAAAYILQGALDRLQRIKAEAI